MNSQKNIQNNLPAGFKNFLKNLKKDFAIESIKIFGSRARGDHHKLSDIDIAVHSSNLNEDDWVKLEDLLKNNSLSLLKIDLVNLATLDDDVFKKRILQEGVEINS